MQWKYKDKYSEEQRMKEATRILNHYEDRVPIIVQNRASYFWGDTNTVFKKFLAPRNLTLGEFYYRVREKITLRPEDGLHFLVNDYQMPSYSATLGSVYKVTLKYFRCLIYLYN